MLGRKPSGSWLMRTFTENLSELIFRQGRLFFFHAVRSVSHGHRDFPEHVGIENSVFSDIEEFTSPVSVPAESVPIRLAKVAVFIGEAVQLHIGTDMLHDVMSEGAVRNSCTKLAVDVIPSGSHSFVKESLKRGEVLTELEVTSEELTSTDRLPSGKSIEGFLIKHTNLTPTPPKRVVMFPSVVMSAAFADDFVDVGSQN